MARKASLTADEIKKYEPKLSESHPRDRLGCGGGLYILYTLAGARSWQHRVRIPGGDSWITLGEYGEAGEGRINYTEARKRQGEAKRRLDAGESPSAIKFGMAAIRAEARQDGAGELTFGEAAREWMDADAPNVKEAARRRRETWYRGYLQEPLGSRPMASITLDELKAAAESPLRKSLSGLNVKTVQRDLARTIGQIYDYARMTHRELQGYWPDAHLPKLVQKAPPVKHRPCIVDPGRYGELLRAINDFYFTCRYPQTGFAMRLIPLIALRPGELVNGLWDEIDFNQSTWTIPAEKMKMQRPHIVPLSHQAIAILNEAKKFFGNNKYIFPSVSSVKSEHIHENTLLGILKQIGFNTATEMCVHGFGGAFSTLMHCAGLFRGKVIEMQLAHIESNTVKGAYDHGLYLPERQELMQFWADYLDALRAGSTLPPRTWAEKQRRLRPRPFEEDE